uniref:Piwi domain-containing protein n=1 Tax=Ditylenchus dipsaci TaxID=166011 RepID=A0A915EF94_9BILA
MDTATMTTAMASLNMGRKVVPAQAFSSKTEGTSSVYNVVLQINDYNKCLDVEIVRIDLDKSLTKAGADDGQKSLYRRLCADLMSNLYDRTENFRTSKAQTALYVYDSRKNLFTNRPINLEHETYEVSPDEQSDFCQLFLRKSPVRISICKSEAYELDLCDVRPSLCSDVSLQADRSLRTFLELLTSQSFLNAGTHDIIGLGKIFERKPLKHLQEGIVTHQGMAKGVRIIENSGNPIPALVLDVKTCAFFNSVSFDRTIQEMLPRGAIWTKNSSAEFETYTKVSAAISHTLRPDRWSFTGSLLSLSVSLCWNANQRVPIEKMSDFISRELLSSNTTNPDVRSRNIDLQVRGMATGDSGDFLKQFGVKIVGGSNAVPIGIRAPPGIEFGERKIVPAIQGKFDERFYKFYSPGGNIKKWLIACSRMVEQDIRRFGSSIKVAADKKGMRLPQPEYETIELNDLQDQFKWISEKEYEFVLYIDSKRAKSHDLLKLMESRYKIPTQQITAEVLSKAGGATYGNIVNKINMKLSGLNYVPRIEKLAQKFELSSGQFLVIGYDVSHPTQSTAHEKFKIREKGVDFESLEPSVICANYAKEPHNFVGDFFYQPARKEAVDPETLQSRMRWILSKLKENRPGAGPPPVIFVVRDGLSEGWLPRFYSQLLPKFVFVIVTKRHNKRFFAKDQNNVVNTTPGSVIDRIVVRPDVPEFFMQSHRPLKGTAKIPQYALAVNEIAISTDEVQAFLNALCHSHQIVNSAISIPAPVYQAHELAKRGRANYMLFKQLFPAFIPKNGEMVDYDALTKRLAYGATSKAAKKKSILQKEGNQNRNSENADSLKCILALPMPTLVPEFEYDCMDVFTAASLSSEIIKRYMGPPNKNEVNSVNCHGWTPLMYASYLGHKEVSQLLLSRQADPEACNQNGQTAIMLAASCGSVALIGVLLKYSAKINQQDKFGRSSLHYAIKYNQAKITEILLEKGADPNLPDQEGFTPTLMACQVGNEATVSILLKYKGNPNCRNKRGEQGITLALGHPKVLELLKPEKIYGRLFAPNEVITKSSANSSANQVKEMEIIDISLADLQKQLKQANNLCVAQQKEMRNQQELNTQMRRAFVQISKRACPTCTTESPTLIWRLLLVE